MKKILCLIITIVLYNLLFSQTTIPEGDISGNWSLDGSPYLIEGEIEIPNGETLTIDPGCFIEFQGHYKLNVQGRLLAIGTEQDSIRFTIADTTGFSNPDTTSGGWHGIRFDDTSALNDSSKIIYSKIQYGKAIRVIDNWDDDSGGGIYINSFSKVLISNSEISNNFAEDSGGGICLRWGPSCIIINCSINSNYAVHNGGGLRAVGGSPIIRNNQIFENKSFRGGGLRYSVDVSAEFMNNDVFNNIATMEAAGIYLGSNSVLVNNNISNNTCIGNHGGGGIYIFGSPTLINNVISHNIAGIDEEFSKGGGLHFSGNCTAYLENNIIEFNQAGQGGGISGDSGSGSTGSSPILFNNRISNNTATFNGGGLLFLHNGNPTLTNNIISNNYAGESGGGIYSQGTGSFKGNLISGNIANEDGGGIYFRSYSSIDSLFVYNNNICFNNSTNSGGGIYCKGSAQPIFINTIIWDNTSLNGEQVFLHWYLYEDPDTGIMYECFPQPEFYYCNITDSLQGFVEIDDPWNEYEYNALNFQNNIDSIPLFINPESDDFHLLTNSPCINAGIPDTIGLSLPEYDLDGNLRIYEDIIDIGCYEWQGTGLINDNISISNPKLFNYPNPFNPSTIIQFDLIESGDIDLAVYNIKGQKVKSLINAYSNKGKIEIRWNGKDNQGKTASSGQYLIKLKQNGKETAIKILLLK